MNLLRLFLNVDVAGGISPPAYQETTPWGPIITIAVIAVIIVIFITVFITVLVTTQISNSKKQESQKTTDENSSEQEEALLKEFRELDENQKAMLLQTVKAWRNKTDKT